MITITCNTPSGFWKERFSVQHRTDFQSETTFTGSVRARHIATELVGVIRAKLEALQVLRCNAHISAGIVAGKLVFEGDIVVWDEEYLELARRVVSALEFKATELMALSLQDVSVRISFRLETVLE